ncbi:MAG: glycogen debranching protein GlgX [Bacteroidales bacterium]|nr:glycogen debranching protein GlgX [Bacteroidales bacterium]
MQRVDLFPTHEYGGYKLRAGRPYPFGATVVGNAVNFSIYSRYATDCTLVLFHNHDKTPFLEIPFFKEFRLGNVFSMMVFDLDYENIEYGYRMDGPFDPRQGHRFDKTKILMDPYAKLIAGRDVWGKEPDWINNYQYRSRVVFDDFDWENDLPLETPVNDLVIYEMHVRNFTCGDKAGVKHPGTFAGIAEKIPYLKELGVNCIELMPIHEFDEFENSRPAPDGHMLYNAWGYSNVGFFAPKAAYASTGKYSMQVDELKNLIKRLHAEGIEVILDVVFNHTAEGNENGPYISYRGIDNKTYYMLTQDGYYFNFSGCGNTLNCNNPNVRDMIVDSLRYWVTDYHVDGFRFDLAAILGRDQNGYPMANPPLLESLAHDPILGKTKLIAEAWDAGGLYQVGSFPSWGRWAEWNGKFRDAVRRFVKGDEHVLDDVKERITGSADLYASANRGIKASVNFVTAHDGFTMMDLVSYDGKHNEANGEGNRDGDDNNNSWNCGWEGESTDIGTNFLRHKQIKNFVSILMTSQGIPMVLSGDEIGNTQFGNNNAYCQDNEISWLDWKNLEKNADIFNYFQKIIKFRRQHKALRYEYHLGHSDWRNLGMPDFSWHGVKAWQPWNTYNNLTQAFMLNGRYADSDGKPDDFIYVAMNMHWEMHGFELPQLPDGLKWYVFANTAMAAPQDIVEPGSEILIDNQWEILVEARSIMILVGK